MTGARFQRLAAELRERITLGDHGPRGELESEAELGKRYDVSRVTVRRALEQLRDEGLVNSRKGAGWSVTVGAIGQALALGTFRHATSAAAETGRPVTRRVVEYGFLEAPADVARTLGLDHDAEVLRARSVRHAGGEPLDTATEWIASGLAGPISRAQAEHPGIWATLHRLGHPVGTVRQSIAAVAAGNGDAELLGTDPGVPLLLVRRIAIGTDDLPLALSDHRYLGHRFRLDVEFRGWPGSYAPESPGLIDQSESPAEEEIP